MGEILAVAASYDPTLKYGAQTPFSDQLSHQWKAGAWEYDPQHGSIITAGNGGTQPTQAALTIFYNQGTQKYELQQTLQPDEQMWIDVGKLIREGVPDKNGKTLPADLTAGSYEFRDLTNTGVGTLFEGKVIYDKTYGHVTYGCATCCGYNATLVFYDPIILTFGGPPGSDGIWGYNVCTQGYDDVSTSFYGDWSSASTSIITVDYYGSHSPQAVGSTTTSTFGSIEGTAHYPNCWPKTFSAGGGGKVNCNVPIYQQTCTPTNGTQPTTLSCGWGGPGTCCNPTIKASAYYGTDNSHSCSNNCVTWTVGNTSYTDCCCSQVTVDPDCASILTNTICETSVTM